MALKIYFKEVTTHSDQDLVNEGCLQIYEIQDIYILSMMLHNNSRV